jgi:hypothetical protein
MKLAFPVEDIIDESGRITEDLVLSVSRGEPALGVRWGLTGRYKSEGELAEEEARQSLENHLRGELVQSGMSLVRF